MRDLCECQGHDANCSLRPSGCLQTLLRQNDTNGGVTKTFTTEMRHMQGKDPTPETNPHPSGLLDVWKVLGSATKRVRV